MHNESDLMDDVMLDVVRLRKVVYRLADIDTTDEDTSVSFGDATNTAIERIETIEERLDEIEEKSDTALGVARAIDTGARGDGGPSKIERARMLSRNEVIRQTATQASVFNDTEGKRIEHVVGSVSNSDVQDMAKPQAELKWQTIDDAWRDLCRDWECFTIDDSRATKTLTLTSVDEIPRELVRVVEADLDRDDLAKRLVGGNAPAGGNG